jgi:hypothetical protein
MTKKYYTQDKNTEGVAKALPEKQPLIRYKFIYHHHLRICPLYSCFPSPKTKFYHLSLSLVSSSVSPWFVMLRLTPPIHLLFIYGLFNDAFSRSLYSVKTTERESFVTVLFFF